MMTPAISTPSVIESSAGRIRIPSSAAIAAPDHAPVPGGHGHEEAEPDRLVAVTLVRLCQDRFSMRVESPESRRVDLSQRKSGLPKST